MEVYDAALAPRPFGLNNTGAICHLNSLLQALVGNTSVVRAGFAHRDYLARTATGRAFYDFLWAAAPGARPAGAAPFAAGAEEVAHQSARVLAALVTDLRARRPDFRYGPSQESASEGLVLLLDMLDAPAADAAGDAEENPISRLFYHRYEVATYCAVCDAQVSVEQKDIAVQFNLFHLDALREPPATPEEFSRHIRSQASPLEDYGCEKCGQRVAGLRLHRLRMVPEVLVAVFNLYRDGEPRVPRYFPPRLPFPGLAGGALEYVQTAQVEHFGSRAGGHYIARGLRAGGIHEFNDSHAAPSAFGPNPNVYMVFYHCESAPA